MSPDQAAAANILLELVVFTLNPLYLKWRNCLVGGERTYGAEKFDRTGAQTFESELTLVSARIALGCKVELDQ